MKKGHEQGTTSLCNTDEIKNKTTMCKVKIKMKTMFKVHLDLTQTQ